MVTWFKDNVLALLLIGATAVGAYNLSINRIIVLEVKVKQQEDRSLKTDRIIENNTLALTKISVLLARGNGKMDTFEYRVAELERRDHEQRID